MTEENTETANAEANMFEQQKAVENSAENKDEDVAKQEVENADEKTSEGGVPVVSRLDDLPPLEQDFYYMALLRDMIEADSNSELHQWFTNKLLQYEVVTEETTKEEAVVEQQVLMQIVQDYVDEKCNDIKNNIFSLNQDTINDALDNMYQLMKLTPQDNLSANFFDKAAYHRVKRMPQLKETYDVVKVGRDIFNMIVLSSSATQIEVENHVQLLEDLYTKNIMDKEQMAFGYHNISILLERLAQNKTATQGGNMERMASYDYMRKALSLTSQPQLIKTCFEYLPDNVNNKMLFIREACDRALENHNLDDSSLYKVHTLYSKSIERSYRGPAIKDMPNEDYREAVYHYQEALAHAGTSERKAKVLRSLAKLQNTREANRAKQTRIELAEKYLEGKTKVRELLKLAAEVKNKSVQTVLLESAVNELIDTNGLKKEEKGLLIANVVNQLRPIYQENQPDKLPILDKIEKQYCVKPKEKTLLISRISSKGHDYFQ